MAKLPYMQWYPRDWLNDPQVSMLCPRARGIWKDWLNAMFVADRAYKLTGTAEQLARAGRCIPDEARDAIQQLQATGAAEVHRDGETITIVSRRFKREHNERKQAAKRQKTHREAARNANITTPSRPCAGFGYVSGSGSESAQSNPEERRNTQTARPHAREEKADEKFTAAADALAEWGWRQPYDACLSGIKTQIGRAIDAIQGAGADIGLIPRAVAHHKSQAKPFKSVDYARSIVLSAINERAWEAVVPVQRQETAKERVDRIMAARAAKNGAKA